jgi:hypothetical protein
MLGHALHSAKVRIIRTDARVAVSLFEKGKLDIVFDNLAYASWLGSSSINSEAYFKRVRALLQPQGVFIKGANYTSWNRLAVLAGLVKTFENVEEHISGEVVIASHGEPAYDDNRVLNVVKSRAPGSGLVPPYENWFRSGFARISEHEIDGTEPIRDDLLIYEYYYHPYNEFKKIIRKYLYTGNNRLAKT